jgi:hypothetical protein
MIGRNMTRQLGTLVLCLAAGCCHGPDCGSARFSAGLLPIPAAAVFLPAPAIRPLPPANPPISKPARAGGGGTVPSDFSGGPYKYSQSTKRSASTEIFFSGVAMGESLPTTPAPAVSLTDPDGFRGYWASRSLYTGFSQVWQTPPLLRSTFPAGPPQDVHPYPEWLGSVDFAQIADVPTLLALSARAESEYMLNIEVERTRFVKENCRDINSPLERAQWILYFDRELARADLFWLGKHVLAYEDMSMHLHYFMCRLVNDVPRGLHALFEFPRDCFKSTIFGIAKTVQQVLNNPNLTVLYISGSLDNAKKKTGEIRNHFTKNEALLRLFPEYRAPNKSAMGSEGEWSAPCRKNFQGEPTVKAAGITSKLASKHVDWMVMDDIWDEHSVTTPDVMAKTRSSFNRSEFLFKRTSLRVQLVIGTRFAQDDLTLDILGDGTTNYPGRKLFKNNCHIVSGILPNGRSIFPEGFSFDWMMDYCNGGGGDSTRDDGGLYDFSCQIMLNPSLADKGFDENWFRALRFAEIQKAAAQGLLSYDTIILSDAAGSDNKGSDRDAIIVVCRDSFGRRTVVFSECQQRAPAAFVNRVFAVFDIYRATGGLVLQKAAIDTVVRSFIDERNVQRAAQGQPVLPVYGYSLHRQDKDERITHALQPLLQRGELYFDPDMEEHDDITKELKHHPASLEKHRIDALSELGDPKVRHCPSFDPAPPPPKPYTPESREDMRAIQDLARREMMDELWANANADDEEAA